MKKDKLAPEFDEILEEFARNSGGQQDDQLPEWEENDSPGEDI